MPPSMLVIGAGATGVQVASIFNAFGSRIQLFEAGPRILPSEDEDVSAAVAEAFRESNIAVNENFGSIESFEKTPTGVRMIFSKDAVRDGAEATLAVVAVGWRAETKALNLAAAGVEVDRRGFVKVDEYLRTSVPHIFAAGDVTGCMMLVPQAIQEGFVAATNAVLGPTTAIGDAARYTGKGVIDGDIAYASGNGGVSTCKRTPCPVHRRSRSHALEPTPLRSWVYLISDTCRARVRAAGCHARKVERDARPAALQSGLQTAHGHLDDPSITETSINCPSRYVVR